MKKILLTGSFLLMLSGMFAQDAKKIKTYLDAKQYEKAKAEVDAAISKNPNDPLALYYKSKVYVALATDPQFKTTVPEAKEQALESFKKAFASDKDNKVMLVAIQDQYKPIFDLYSRYYESGIQAFNNAKGNKAGYADAMTYFIKSNEVGKYINTNKWAKIPEIDTTIVLLIGQSAYMADKKDSAFKYFKQITDANIHSRDQDASDYSLPYRWLTFHYKEAKDEANFLKYAMMSKKYFPKDDYFDALMLDYYRDKKDYDGLFKKYEETIASFPDSSQYHFNYAADAFNYVYNRDAGIKITNKEAIIKTIGTESQKALSLKPNDINTTLLLGQFYYNTGIDLKDQVQAVKGTKPEDIKRKAELNAQAKEAFNKAIPYGEKGISQIESNGYKKVDKSKYKTIADLMQTIYTSLNQSDKVKLYQQKYDTADAKFIN